MKPNKSVLRAFNISGVPIRLIGGQGTSYLVDNIVLKPVENEVEASWVADIFNNLKTDGFRVAKPICTKENLWIFDGWSAYECINGKHLKNKYSETVKVSKLLHKSLANISKPSFLEKKNDAWAIADRIAWSELPISRHKLTDKSFDKIFNSLEKNNLPSQIIHGDIGGNILFDDNLSPAVIDFSPSWRPANFAIAVGIIDWIVWDDAPISIIHLCKDHRDFDQLLLRALIRRTSEYIEHEKNDGKDRSKDIFRHMKIVDALLEEIKK